MDSAGYKILEEKINGLQHSFTTFLNQYDKDQKAYREGAAAHRQEHNEIKRLFHGSNGSTAGIVEQVHSCHERVKRLEDENKRNDELKSLPLSWKIGIVVTIILNFTGIAFAIFLKLS